MTIHRIIPDTKETALSLVFGHEIESNDVSDFAVGQKQIDWKSFELEWNLKSERSTGEFTKNDFILIIGVGVNIALNEKAKTVLESVFKNDAEFLPINVKGDNERYYLLNVLNVVDDALDLKHCEFRIRSNGEMGSIKTAVFDENKIPDNRIFITPYKSTSAMFKGKLLMDTCNKYGLTGLDFRSVLSTST
ncbi:imm11 family protein [Aliikangiella sp. IMCC44359]|uniref:imm11 family protein n=1 Tax=Aliikangiella sp. IMCC44359 TaxID=3459125 RepID=UPI00403AB61A